MFRACGGSIFSYDGEMTGNSNNDTNSYKKAHATRAIMICGEGI